MIRRIGSGNVRKGPVTLLWWTIDRQWLQHDLGLDRKRLHGVALRRRWPELCPLPLGVVRDYRYHPKKALASTDEKNQEHERQRYSTRSADMTPSQNTGGGNGGPDSLWSRLHRAWRVFLEGARVYARGTAQLYRNMRKTSKLEKRLRETGHEALSYPEHLLLIQTRHDRWRALLLLSVSLVSTALIPVLAEAIPGFKPTTFTTDQDRQMMLRMQGIRYLEAQMVLWRAIAAREDATSIHESLIFPCVTKIGSETVKGALRECSRPELFALCKLFGQPAFPVSLSRSLRARLAQHFQELASLDDALQRDGLSTLTQSQLEDACLMRGLPAYGRSADEMRGDLGLWMQRTRKSARELLRFIADEHLQNRALLGWSAPLLKRALGER